MFTELLEQLGPALNASGIPYMLIGGQAVLLYGEPRLTRDIDLTLGIGPERLPDLLKMVEAIGLQVRVVNVVQFVTRTMVLPCEQPGTGIRVDFVLSSSAYEQQALQRARVVTVGQAELRFAALEDLVIHKVIAGRPRDLEDVRTVLLKNPNADATYIRQWLEEFERALAEPYRQRFEEIWKITRRQASF